MALYSRLGIAPRLDIRGLSLLRPGFVHGATPLRPTAAVRPRKLPRLRSAAFCPRCFITALLGNWLSHSASRLRSWYRNWALVALSLQVRFKALGFWLCGCGPCARLFGPRLLNLYHWRRLLGRSPQWQLTNRSTGRRTLLSRGLQAQPARQPLAPVSSNVSPLCNFGLQRRTS